MTEGAIALQVLVSQLQAAARAAQFEKASATTGTPHDLIQVRDVTSLTCDLFRPLQSCCADHMQPSLVCHHRNYTSAY